MTCADLAYDVVYCTSQDDDYPVFHLSETASGSDRIHRGWQSARFGKVPQTLVLRFHGNVWLQQIRILSHETNISSKVEVRVFQLKKEMLSSPPSFRGARFTKLGAVEFNTNEQSNFRSKERKTVHLKTEAYFLKLLFGKPYANSFNTGQQIGVYSIECCGYMVSNIEDHVDQALTRSLALPPAHAGYDRGEEHHEDNGLPSSFSAPPQPPLEQQTSRRASDGPGMQSSPPPLPGDGFNSYRSLRILDFEEFFIRRAEELISLKEQALQMQDMALAQACRDRLSQLNCHSKDIYRLEQEKVQSIIQENFDEAKKARDAMNALIEKAIAEARMPDPVGEAANSSEAGVAVENAAGHSSSSEEAERAPPHWLVKAAVKRGSKPEEEEVSHRDAFEEDGRESDTIDVVQDEDQPVKFGELHPLHRLIGERIVQRSGESVDNLYYPNVSYDTTLLNTWVGPAATACLFSKKFRFRECALLEIKNELSECFRESCSSVEDCIIRFLDLNSYGLQDTFPNVFVAACSFIQTVLEDPCNCLSSVLAPVVALIPRLLTRACDSQTRVREEALNTLKRFAQAASIPPIALLNAVIAEPVDRDRRKLPISHARAQVVRLTFLQVIVDEHRLSVSSASSEKLLNTLLIPGANHANGEVRDLASSLLSELVQKSLIVLKDRDLSRINNSMLRDSIKNSSSKEM